MFLPFLCLCICQRKKKSKKKNPKKFLKKKKFIVACCIYVEVLFEIGGEERLEVDRQFWCWEENWNTNKFFVKIKMEELQEFNNSITALEKEMERFNQNCLKVQQYQSKLLKVSESWVKKQKKQMKWNELHWIACLISYNYYYYYLIMDLVFPHLLQTLFYYSKRHKTKKHTN